MTSAVRNNPLLGTATFVFPSDPAAEGRQEFHLVLNNRVWIEAEAVLGYSILDAVEELRAALESGRNPRLKTMCAIVYGGLKQNHPDVTEDMIVDMFLSGDPAFKAGVLQAMRGAQLPDIPDEEDVQQGNVQAPRGGKSKVGTGSGSSNRTGKPAAARKSSGKKPRAR
ncbi:hypothetical protein HT136_01680 [Novosphingobium profundi]|uniref:hypothetical protein n=1 Tax=Novosphingobium profundi TaxID=1774954 RepID=UPI001BDAB589|nr:hypothetical protein [Novosphingobium profundi]MBT0667077.1 hypothetical protein [Novosphingobium profundi]